MRATASLNLAITHPLNDSLPRAMSMSASKSKGHRIAFSFECFLSYSVFSVDTGNYHLLGCAYVNW